MANNYNFSNVQIGNNNNMYNTYESKSDILQEKQWKELEKILDKRLKELKYVPENYMIEKEILKYSKQRDEKGLKKFIDSNKDAFITNVLSDLVSAGLSFMAKLIL